jgi:prepilin-type N-terminal cleavage/methylation domain-containing protein
MRPSGHKGFTLIEIAIVMVIIGLLTGGGISILKLLTERKARNDNLEYLQQAKEAILSFANINGRLPRPDTNGDGQEDACANPCVGLLPFINLNIAPNDAYQRGVKYEISDNPENLRTDRGTTCITLSTWNPASGSGPLMVDIGPTAPFAVTAILVSGGPMDADGAGGALDRHFDAIAGVGGGNNITGTPNYIRSSPTNTFDDVVVFIGGYELNSKIDCAASRCSAYEIWNNIGAAAYFRVNGIGCSQIANNALISSVGPGGSVFGYSDASCSTATTPTSRTAAAAAISDTNRNCVVNFTGSLPDP